MLKITWFLLAFTLIVLAVCYEINKNETETETEIKVKLSNAKDSLSYILGAKIAQEIVKETGKDFARLNKEQIIIGFNSDIKSYSPSKCISAIQKLFGKNFQDFNEKYVSEGSLNIGIYSAYSFYYDIRKVRGNDYVNKSLVYKGYADGLYKKDAFLSNGLKEQIAYNFYVGLNEKHGAKMMAQAKLIKGAQLFENGVVIETIKAGNGPMPGLTDDVKVHYILTSAVGDTIQNSFEMTNNENKIEPVALSLNGGVIPGWSYAIPKMKVGGTYRLYLPWELAYGEQNRRESLCFVVELVARVKSGSFTDLKENKPGEKK